MRILPVIVICARLLFALILIMALVAGMKSQPVTQVIPHFDLILHCGVFAVLAFLWLVGTARRFWLWGLVGLLLLGAGLELWQGWIMPARTASLFDMAANGTGVALGALAFFVLARFLRHLKG